MIYFVGRGEMSVWSKTPLKRAPFWPGFSGRNAKFYSCALLVYICRVSDFDYRISRPAGLDRKTINWLEYCVNFSSGSLSFRQSADGALVDVAGDFDCSGQDLVDFKGVRFGRVGGTFRCGYNKLRSLAGAPREVGGSFYCGNNELSNLIGAPERVDGPLYFGNNRLVSLEGAPVRHGTVPGIFIFNAVSAKTLFCIYDDMAHGSSYPEALENSWNEMSEEDKMLMYADNPGLSADERKGYELMDRVREISI